MKKWWKRSKNRILSLSLALLISITSVLPSMNVEASSGSSDVLFDANGDGQFTLDEVLNPFKFMSYIFTTCGYWWKEGTQEIIEGIQEYRDWLALGPAVIVGSIDDSGMITISDETWNKAREIANIIRGNEGFTKYPGLPSDRFYFYNLAGGSMTGTELEKFTSADGRFFKTGVAVGFDDSIGYMFFDPTYWANSTSSISNANYYTDILDYVFINENGYIFPYKVDMENFTFTRALGTWYEHRFYRLTSTMSRVETHDDSDFGSKNMQSLISANYFRGLLGLNCVVFNSTNSALNYLRFDRSFFDGSDFGVTPKVSLDVLNQKDWVSINNAYYKTLFEQLQEAGVLSLSGSQAIIDEFSKDVLSSLEFLEGEAVEQTHFLKGIYELLKEWLPKLFNKDTNVDVDVDVNIEEDMGQFDDESNNQSDELDSLIQDSQVEKPDIDNTNQLVDENLDMGNVEEYGTLLSVFTGNQRILSFILISLTVGLIAYVFYGKR